MNAIIQTPLAPPPPSYVSVSCKRRQLRAAVIVPTNLSGRRPLLVLHGISRDSQALLRHFGPQAQRTGRIIVAPRFSRKHWPVFQRPTRKNRPDSALLALLDALSQHHTGFDRPLDIFGYSGGAQLAHRAAMLYPQRFAHLHLGAAGWYCLPSNSQPYPYGLGGAAAEPANLVACKRAMLPAFLDRPITVYAGACDTQRDDALRQNPTLDATQGATRLARAKTYVATLRAAAKAHNITPQVRFVELPGCGHSFDECAARAGLARMVSGDCPTDLASL